MNTCAFGSAANDGGWRPVAIACLPVVAGYAAEPRSGDQTLDKTLDTPVSTVFDRSLVGVRAGGGKLCRASAGTQSFAL